MGAVEQLAGAVSYNDQKVEISRGELRELRRRAAYYQAQFEIRKRKTERLLDFCRKMKAEKKKLWRRLFGKKSEAKNNGESKREGKGGKRGKKPGTKGHGRKPVEGLPTTTEQIDLAEDEKKCPCCGLEFDEFPETSDQEIIEVDVKAHKRIVKRKRYKKACSCPKVPSIISAPQVPQLIPKGKFGVSFWMFVLLQKFWFHKPLSRITKELKSYGLAVSPGTIVGGFSRLEKLIQPLYRAIEIQNKSEHFWHADETRWLVFVKMDGKSSYRWYLWVFRSETTVFFKLAPTRGRSVVDEHFQDSWGVLSVDRYASYKVLLSTGRFLLAFCWAHVRRDFLEIEVGYAHLAEWCQIWVERIGELYHINNARVASAAGSVDFSKLQTELEQKIRAFKQHLDEEIEFYKDEVISARRQVLESLRNHWHGLTLFVQFSWVPMDNNSGEQSLRGPVVARKNYYGSGSLSSCRLTAQMHSILGTWDLWGLNAKILLEEYLNKCASNGGKAPKNINAFLPWKMSKKQLQELGAKSKRKPLSQITKEQIKCATVDEVFRKKKSKSSDKSSAKPLNQNIADTFQRKSVKDSIGPGPPAV